MTSTTSEIENQSSKTFIFRSKLPNIPISNNLSLHSYCFEKVSEFSERTCLITASNGKTYTFAETHLISKKTAIGLSNLGIKKGDVIMILLQNCPEFVFSFMGASMLGAITTTSNPFYTPSEIFKQFSASGARIIITQSQFVEKLRDPTENFPKIGEDLTVITIDDPPENCLHFSVISNSKESEIQSVSIDPDDPVVLPFSSGTTGFSKGVILTHKSMITAVAQVVDGENPSFYLRSDDIVLCVLPLFHKFCLKCVLLCSLRAGVGILLMEKFKIETMLEWIQKYRVSVAPIVPPLVLALANNPMVESFDLSSIRIVMSGAAPVGKELDEALRNRLPQAIFGQVYGMTEAGVVSMCLGFAKQPFPSKSGSCGAVARNLELKIVDPETGFSLWHNQPGEICIRGPQIMKGYLNNTDATSTTIDVEGWLHTGDIGYVDDDEEIFIVDRLKELIKVKGFQVPPAELEALLLSHPSISDAAVVPQKDVAAGEVPVAFVVPSRNDFELTEEAIKEFIAKQVVFYKRLHKVYFILAIPKSPSGKILRRVLRAKLTSGS